VAQQVWRVGAYAICRRGDEVLLVRATSRTLVEGRWFLPGGGVEFGEAPEDAVLRELTEETGLSGAAPRIAMVYSEMHDRPNGDRMFSVRLIYDVDVEDGTIVEEHEGTSGEVRWVRTSDVTTIGPMPYVVAALGLEASK
jgi:ADP-ribose pyrophosphatase YjhB (NUDIX family)